MHNRALVIVNLLLLTLLVPLFAPLAGSASAQDRSASSTRRSRYGQWLTPVNLGRTINSTSNDLAPALTKDGLSLYFTSNRQTADSFGGEDIWVSHRDTSTGEWDTPINLGPVINTTSNERLRSISSDGRLMLFQCDRPDGFGGTDIWVSKRSRINDDFAWERPVNLGPTINSNMNELGAAYLLGIEGRNHKLYFSSNRTDTGGLGGADLYSSDIPDGGSFGPPVDLIELNSASNDTCLTISDDGLEIIFSSNRPDLNNSMNMFDLWTSSRKSVFDAWNPPTNLGSSVNAVGFLDANPSLSSDGKTLVFTSNRNAKGSVGGMDLYITTRKRLDQSQ